jgi:peptidylprolyl isomerase
LKALAAALLVALLAGCTHSTRPAAAPRSTPAPTLQQVLDASPPADWRRLDPADTLYMDLGGHRVVIELAPAFAPLHADNIRTLARSGYFDGLAIVRVQDNFVVQWGDPDAGEATARPLGAARTRLPPEFERDIAPGLAFTPLGDGDVYAPEVGFSAGMPAARDPETGTTWLAHCYGMVGAGRDDGVETGNGAELYVVIGHAPRQLDRNIALVGRVIEGMQYPAALPRGSGALGFHESAEQRVPITSVRIAADLPEGERLPLERLRTDRAPLAVVVESRRNGRDAWYHRPAGAIDLCNGPLPVRTAPDAPAH